MHVCLAACTVWPIERPCLSTKDEGKQAKGHERWPTLNCSESHTCMVQKKKRGTKKQANEKASCSCRNSGASVLSLERLFRGWTRVLGGYVPVPVPVPVLAQLSWYLLRHEAVGSSSSASPYSISGASTEHSMNIYVLYLSFPLSTYEPGRRVADAASLDLAESFVAWQARNHGQYKTSPC